MVPQDWMPDCVMARIIFHWTAGAHNASDYDREHYHILVNGDGTIVRGTLSIAANVNTSDGQYAAHTKNCNTGSIGVSVAAMAEAVESPFDPGPYPITVEQWSSLAAVLADLCMAYGIPVSRETVLSHAEVQDTLEIAQSGKWDISWPPMTAHEVGDSMRRRVQQLIDYATPHTA